MNVGLLCMYVQNTIINVNVGCMYIILYVIVIMYGDEKEMCMSLCLLGRHQRGTWWTGRYRTTLPSPF